MHKQSAYVRELFAVTQAMAKFRHYLLGHRFIIGTDHRSLKELLSQPLHTPEQQQWLPKFLGYDFEVQYRPGKENLAADALSRSMFLALSTAEPSWLLQVQQSLQADPHWQNILTTTRTSSLGSTPFTCYNGLLYWKNRLVIPEGSGLRPLILKDFHDSLVGGHAGIARTTARICASFYWSGMHKDIKKYVQHCLLCQQTKHSTSLPSGLLQPLPIP